MKREIIGSMSKLTDDYMTILKNEFQFNSEAARAYDTAAPPEN